MVFGTGDRKLRVIFINHTHPEAKHVSAVRMGRLADALARQGDRVAIVTPPLPHGAPAAPPHVSVVAHDWERPLSFSVQPKSAPVLVAARTGSLPWGVRQAVLASAYITKGSVFGDWSDAVIDATADLLTDFEPDVIYATLGNTGNWQAAQTLANKAGVPWVADLKDNYEAFVPAPFRRRTAVRFSSMSAMTVFSDGHARMAKKWFDLEPTVVYSGIDPLDDLAVEGVPSHFLLMGSLYAKEAVATFVRGLQDWWARSGAMSSESPPPLLYAGNDGALFRDLVAPIQGMFETKDLGFLPLRELVVLASKSVANAYVVNPASLFQHKVFEFLQAGRPIIALPGETEEAVDVCAKAGGVLYGCATGDEVMSAIERIMERPDAGHVRANVEAYTWASQGAILRRVLSDAVGTGR